MATKRKRVGERGIALAALLAVTEDGEHSHIVLQRTLEKYQYLEKRERAFITRVVRGTLQRLLTIDYILDRYSKVKTRKMKPVIRGILRTATYQIYYMDAVPDAAACNEAVKLAKEKGFGELRGFVNGVLRALARGKGTVAWPEPADSSFALSVRYSVPEWIVRQWADAYGCDTAKRMLADALCERPTTIRCNTHLTTPDALQTELEAAGVRVERHKELPYAMAIGQYDHLSDLAAFREGRFYVQDISSMHVAEAADPSPGDFVLDICAAPGGKALHVAEKLGEGGFVEARDISASKLSLIEENLKKSGLSNVRLRQFDATAFDPQAEEQADVLIADLPCSGLGVLSRKAELRYRASQAQEEELARLQRAILEASWRYVKKGGTLIYSTCTVNRAENEDNASWLAAHFPFTLLWEKQYLPGIDGGDGFYIAKFRRDR